jgi:phage terminase small subunit
MAMPPTSGRDTFAPIAAEDVEARAARLGITAERVLKEYARIAFSDLGDIAEWDEQGLRVKPSGSLSEDDIAAIAEIVASASTGTVYRIKLHDKKPVLNALARHLGLLPPAKHASGADETSEDGEDPREVLIREVDRLAAEEDAGSGDPQPEG